MWSFSILDMAGTVSSRVLSLGPTLDVFSFGADSSLGTLKPPGLSLLVAVLSRRPARKKEAISATPAAIMSRLNTQEITVLALDLVTLYLFMTAAIVASKPPFVPRPAFGRSTFYGQVLPHAPLVPRTVVDGQLPVPETVQCEEGYCRSNPAVAVGDHRLISVLGYTSFRQLARQLLVGEEGAGLCIEESVGVEMGGTWHVAPPTLPAHHGPGVLTLVARVEYQGLIPGGQEIFGLLTPAASGPRHEDGRLGCGHLGRRRAVFGRPLCPTAVQDGDTVVAVEGQGPPQPGGELAARVIVDHDVRVVADAQRAHSLGEAVRGGDLRRHRVVGVGDVAGPVHVEGAGDVRLVVFLARSKVLGLLAAPPEISLFHVAPYVYDADIAQMVGEPVRRYQGIEIFHIIPRRWRACGRRFRRVRWLCPCRPCPGVLLPPRSAGSL